MHVVGKLKRGVINQRAQEIKTTPIQFFRTRQ
jgi:hypothetical protein